MKMTQNPAFKSIEIDDILSVAAQQKEKGNAFVQICATTMEESVELLYTFQDLTYQRDGMDGFIVNVPDGAAVPSITELFPAAFVFENETHDLFGVNIEGINIDFEGKFYTVNVAYPMNPRAAAADADAKEAADE